MKNDWTPEDLIEAFSMTSEKVNWVYGATPQWPVTKGITSISTYTHAKELAPH